ncbi:MAG TPA: hypothetical protein VFS05_07425 [Gemmatimonadaceae bacterium]|nr:hypothetical protein [Gemmatimonadaceae bacterium]
MTRAYNVGPRVERAAEVRGYQPRPDDPLHRPLCIYALDPDESRFDGAVAVVKVPYEPLEPGPVGALLAVEDVDDGGRRWAPVDLDHPTALIANGRTPSPTDPRFHQQMVYAVCSTVYTSFRRALGRPPAWGFVRRSGESGRGARLRIRPHALHERNAYYDEHAGALLFGWFEADEHPGPDARTPPRGLVFTCLSHDIVAHEVTHALLDGMRAHFTFPAGPDVLAFHEAFADLVALFQHFSYDDVVRGAIGAARGRLSDATALTDLARQFGRSTGARRALRSALGETDPLGRPLRYDAELETHQLGSVLVAAVWEAFTTTFERKTRRYLRLATNGSGVPAAGDLPDDLVRVLAEEASELAAQFLTICIRAIDYCPPVDLEMGEWLRAVITADRDLVPDDKWGYREALVDAFRRRGIFPSGVSTLSEDALLWRPPRVAIPPVEALAFAELKFRGEPGLPAGAAELLRQARALGELVASPAYTTEFGLARAGPLPDGGSVDPPCVESIRATHRVGPDGQLLFDLVAEVTQRREVLDEESGETFDFYGGATVIIGPAGELRYVIGKGVLSERRLRRQRDFMRGEQGRRYWVAVPAEERAPRRRAPLRGVFRLLHAGPEMPAEDAGSGMA